jgi:2-methylcitrate dehydratase PrpD
MLVEGLGSTWLLLENGHKRYPSASLTHPVIDAAVSVADGAVIDADAVREITAAMHPFAAEVTAAQHPDSPTAARFSAPHCIAVAVLRGSVRLADFAQATIASPSVSALRGKVRLESDGSISKRSARIQITLMDGTRIEESVDTNRGCPGNPITDKELEDKFREAAEQPATSTAAKEIINLCWQLESYPDIRACLSLLSNVNATEPNRSPDLTG